MPGRTSASAPTGATGATGATGSTGATGAAGAGVAAGGAAGTILAKNSASDYDTVWVPGLLPNLKNIKPVSIVGSALATGDNDLYTVPVGKQALFGLAVQGFNNGSGNITWYPEIKVGGVYYRYCAASTLTTGTAAALNNNSLGVVLQAGESVSVNVATNNGLNVRTMVYEWDATDTRLQSARLLGTALASGNNTLLTVPASKIAVFSGSALAPVPANQAWGVLFGNNTGGSITYTLYRVPSGQSAGAGYQFEAAPAVATIASNFFSVPDAVLAAGDTLVLNASAGDSGAHHVAWTTYLLLDA